MGKPKTGQHRLLKVYLNSVEQRNEVLSGSKKLKDIDKFKHIFINPDLCANDRKEKARLRKVMMQTRADNPGKRVYIKKNVLYLEDKVVDKCDVIGALLRH